MFVQNEVVSLYGSSIQGSLEQFFRGINVVIV